MSSGGGFFSSLFRAARSQSADVYGGKSERALIFYIIFALAAAAVPVVFVVCLSLLKAAGVFD